MKSYFSLFVFLFLIAFLVTTAQSADEFDLVQQYEADMLFIRAADLDRDNYVDLVWTSSAGIGAFIGSWIAYGRSDGLFESAIGLNGHDTSPMILEYADSDSLLDIITLTGGGVSSSLKVYLNNGDRTFTNVFSLPVATVTIPSIAGGYFDNDAILDVVMGSGEVMIGTGSGSFVAADTVDSEFDAADVADFNGDGIDDLVAFINLSAGHDDSLAIFLNDGTGTFSRADAVAVSGSVNNISTAGGLADFNRDGNVDFALGMYLGGPSMLVIGFTDGAGNIQLDTISHTPGYFKDVVVEDVNRDNELDLIVSNASAVPDPKMVVFYGDGNGDFPDSVSVGYGSPTGINLALASGDFDRDGNPDFVSAGSFFNESPLAILFNNAIDEDVKPDEMVVTSYSPADIMVVNPGNFTISRNITTVGGADYQRNDVNDDGQLDRESYDYNLQDGDYCIYIIPDPSFGNNDVLTVGIRINGTQQAKVFLDYDLDVIQTSHSANSIDTIVFCYSVEEGSSISPPNGIPTDDTKPLFEWINHVPNDASPVGYDFQLDEDFYFGSPRMDITGLSEARYAVTTALGADSVFYWRYRIWDGTQYSNYSTTFAVYVTPDCCSGIRGNTNDDPADGVNISDVTYLVDYLFGVPSGPEPGCNQEANVNGDPLKRLNISDLTYLVAYLFGVPNGPAPPACP